MNKRQLGTEYENVAAEYLQSQGFLSFNRYHIKTTRRIHRHVIFHQIVFCHLKNLPLLAAPP